MRRAWLSTRTDFQCGFSIVEALLAGTLFGLFAMAFVGVYLYGQEATVLSGDRARATLLAKEGLEAVRNIRDESFAALIDGTHGLATTSNQWNLSGSSDTVGIFARFVEISSPDDDRRLATSTVTWQQNAQRIGSVALATQFTQWKDTGGSTCSDQANEVTLDVSGAELSSGNIQLNNIFILNTNSSCFVVVDKVTLTWTNLIRELTSITFGNAQIWGGSAITGTENDVDDTTIESDDGSIEMKYRFDGNMVGNVFVITAEFSDETSTTTNSFTPL